MHSYPPWLRLLPRRPIRTGVHPSLVVAAIAAVAFASSGHSEACASSPLPSKRGGISVGDTAVVRDSLSVSMTTTGLWTYGSVPSAGLALDGRVYSVTSLLAVPGVHNAELHWYSPNAVVKEFDLDPTLTNAQGAQNSHPVLALSIPRRPTTAAPSDSLWVSLTYRLDPVGLDLSRALYFELWVNDFRDDRIRRPGVRLHVDLGAISEDQMRTPDQPPNRRLDSEDGVPQDNVLGPTEDTGADAAGDAFGDGLSAPVDLATASEQDRGGDDYEDPWDQYGEIDPRRWMRTNGTERNRHVMPYPDTEDLNLNGNLDTDEDYVEYTIDLGNEGTPYLVTDVYAEFAGTAVPHPPGVDNGWRRYRIPFDATDRLQFGNPDLTIARHVRVWIEGLLAPDAPEDATTHVKRPLLMLGGMVIFGWPRRADAGTTTIAPAVLGLLWPNPAREDVTIQLVVPQPQHIDLTVYDLGGRRVRDLIQRPLVAGWHQFTWDHRDAEGARVSPGLYFVVLRGLGHESSAKVVLVE